MDLKELLGEDYVEGMTADDISGVFEKRLLATGRYENKEKVDAERKKAKADKADLEAKIKSKMSDDELSKQEMEELKKELETLRTEKIENNKRYSKTLSEANMGEIKTLLEIKETDKEYAEFVTNISVEDSEISGKTSNYVAKLVKNAYEKGKAEATKKALGTVGNMAIGTDGKTVDKDTAFVKSMIVSAPKVAETKFSNFK